MLLTFEGIDGSGKSTQARLLVNRLGREGWEPVFVREPGGTELSERIRALLLDPSLHVTPYAELLLFSAARAQLVTETIRPALERGAIVICDRFFDSTIAYQGVGRQVEDAGWLHDFQLRVTGGLVPDRTYLFSITPAAALSRRAIRSPEGADRMEGAGEAFYDRVARAYEEIAEREPGRVRVLDGTLSVERLHETIWSEVQGLLARPGGTPR